MTRRKTPGDGVRHSRFAASPRRGEAGARSATAEEMRAQRTCLRTAVAKSDHMKGFAMPRLLARIGIVLAILLLLIAALSFWLLRSESGLHFVLARAIGATEGKLTIERSSGSLAGPATIEGLRYTDPKAGVDARVARTTIAFAPLELLASRLHLTQVALDGIDVALTSVEKAP